ncbi:MAG TPA: dTDP-4-dehydrorhamnose reductase [Fervidicoccus fontis]|uniref:dTDP-4-dehydrorhamnose reductase n=1 Tax=Fervidicoccus fontis TaxID=683846 RepID=A0A7C2YSX9_9CREN|nr:dTDP-4-dehydrorhamnose reductase [Fervidicoccus fontis]
MRVLITGATGLLGYHLLNATERKGFDVFATYHERKIEGFENVRWIRVDFEDVEKIEDTVKSARPDVIIHSAAFTDVDGCEKERAKAYRINYHATRALASISSELKARMIYISTDYVFDGEMGFYREEDIPNPLNFYGLTKLLGEVSVESLLRERGLIVRVSGLYGYSPTGKKNFGLQALEKMMRKEEVKAFVDQHLSPTYVPFLAERLLRALEMDVNGIIHIAGERMSRYEFALALAEELGIEKNLVVPVSMKNLDLPAKRPRDSSLDSSRAREFGLSMPPQREGMRHFIEYYREKVIRGGV